MDLFTPAEIVRQLPALENLIGKMQNYEVESLTDEEIEKAVGGSVSRTWAITSIKQMRDNGMTIEDVMQYRFDGTIGAFLSARKSSPPNRLT